jgi:hypothetical protein
MKILKRVLVIVAIVFGVVFIISLFLPSKYHVERYIVINSPMDSLFHNINNLREWNKWIPFNKESDTTFEITYSEPSEGVGASQKWDGKKLGRGNLKIIKSENGKKIEYEESLGDQDFKTNGTFLFKDTANGVKVTWQEEGSNGFNQIARIFGKYYDKLIGGDFERGLENLKKVSEKK